MHTRYPLLMFANHISWWDGFVQYRLNKEVFGKKLHVMMLEQELIRHKLINRCGCFSIRKNSRSIIESLRYSAKVLENPANMVLMFPQGSIRSLYTTDIDFESGALYLMKIIGNEYRVIFNVNLIDYGPYKKPSLDIYHQAVDPSNIGDPEGIGGLYNRFYRKCLTSQSLNVW
ncbi:MAG: lysophospholipid acyltransferase family protein [Alistipes sp.]|nr:lysophospholipid acyltransferase family protein [Alistipes sp.]